jgi:hypothetical protein
VPGLSRCNRYPPREKAYFAAANETTLPVAAGEVVQNLAQAFINRRLLEKISAAISGFHPVTKKLRTKSTYNGPRLW